jgi:membrane-associated phospholipid phosphatase
VIDYGGEPVGAALLVAAVLTACLLLGHRRAAVLTMAAAGSTVAVTTVLKPVVGRTIHGGYLSFPSGHTALATALAFVAALLAVGVLGVDGPQGVLVVLATATVAGVAMAWAEVALGAHYPTDAIGGFATALAVVPATAWLVDLIADRGFSR